MFSDKNFNMKRVYLVGAAAMVLLLGSCGGSSSEIDMNDVLTQDPGTNEIHDAAAGFSEGLSSTGQQYFSGLLAEVIEVDVKFKEVERMDDLDADAEKIKETLDATLNKIDEGREAIALYESENWPQRAEFHTLTEEWFDTIENLVNDHLYDLAEQLSRPEDTWTQDDWTTYEMYLVDLEAFYEVDKRWVAFQFIYADANKFEIGQPIDEEAMVNDAMVDDAISEDGIE